MNRTLVSVFAAVAVVFLTLAFVLGIVLSTKVWG